MKHNIYSIKEIKPKIFLVSFKNQYDLSMYFLRYQEFYESPSSKFRGKQFQLLDFIKWYSIKYGEGNFTYPTDWDGFNLLGNVIKQVNDLGIIDFNDYDKHMRLIYDYCYEQVGDDNFCIIGSNRAYYETIRHEIAHGFFYLIPEYKKEMTKLVKSLDENIIQYFNKELKRMGYTPKVYVDEIQAYMATGLPFNSDQITAEVEELWSHRKPFIKLYNKYYKKK